MVLYKETNQQNITTEQWKKNWSSRAIQTTEGPLSSQQAETGKLVRFWKYGGVSMAFSGT